jgi:dihydrofolate reductase
MRMIVSWLFLSLDGVVESPEKWVMFNDEMDEAIKGEAAAADTLLLGRRTYEVFAASWPERTVEDDALADWMNTTPKLVASSSLDAVEWQNSTLITGDVAEELAAKKQEPGKNILINGSPTLARSLLRDNLLDELRLFLHPLVVGAGGRLFEDGGDRVPLKLADSNAFSTGVLSPAGRRVTKRPGSREAYARVFQFADSLAGGAQTGS